MKPNLIITSDGLSAGTKVFTPLGEQIKGIMSLEVRPLSAEAPLVEVTIRVMCVALGDSSGLIGKDGPKVTTPSKKIAPLPQPRGCGYGAWHPRCPVCDGWMERSWLGFGPHRCAANHKAHADSGAGP